MILFINACVQKESRTKRLADCLLDILGEPFTEVCLKDIAFPVTDEEYLAKRDSLIAEGNFSDPMFALANQFVAADRIVIAAPHWDLSFPASLKQYIENINVVGITFKYTPEGVPVGLCKAKELYYVSSVGGNFAPEDYGFGYIKAMAQAYYGIGKVELIQACGLDLIGADVEKILEECMERIANGK